MSTIDCSVIRDLLPLYVEKICSEETRKVVDEHLAGCQDCRNLLEDMATEEVAPIQVDAAPLKSLRKKLTRSRIGLAVFAALVVAILGSGVVGYLTADEYVSYTPDLLQVEGGTNPWGDGGSRVSVCVNDGGVQMRTGRSEGDHDTVYVSVWTSVWEKNSPDQSAQCDGYWSTSPSMNVYYMSLDSTENILIYGPGTASGDNTELMAPRYELGDYLIWAGVAFCLLGVAVFLFRGQESVRVWLERAALVPVAYVVGHLCVKGFSVETYAYQRDLSLIVIVGVVVYLVALLGLHLYRVRKSKTHDLL